MIEFNELLHDCADDLREALAILSVTPARVDASAHHRAIVLAACGRVIDRLQRYGDATTEK